VLWCATALEAAKGADVLVALTEWNEFRALDLNEVRQVMRGNVLVDLRNVYHADLAEAAGLAYHGIGRAMRYSSPSYDGRETRPNGAAPRDTA
jgi:UDPglucose 6-dehydrogenase